MAAEFGEMLKNSIGCERLAVNIPPYCVRATVPPLIKVMST